MAQQSMLMGLLKTPSQVRQEQQEKLAQDAYARSQQMITGGGTTALPGILSRYGAQAAQRGAMAGAGLLRGVAGGLGTAVGGDMGQRIADLGVTAEERQARSQQSIISELDQSKPESYFNVAQKLKDQGLIKAAMALTEKGRELQATQAATARQERLDQLEERKQKIDEAFKGVEAAQKGQEIYLEGERLKVDQSQLALKQQEFDVEMNQLENIIGLDLSNTTATSQAQARKVFASGKNQGETDAQFQARIAGVLKDIDKSTKINLTNAEETAFAKAEGQRYSKKVGEMEDKASKAQKSMLTIKEGSRLLEEGIITGLGADVTLDFLRLKKFFNMADASEEELISRTEQYTVTMAQEVLAILGTGDLGAGTGLSDSDREFAREMSLQSKSLDENSLRELLDIARRARIYALKEHNEFAERVNKKYNAGIEEYNYAGRTARNPETGEEMIYVETPQGSGWQMIYND